MNKIFYVLLFFFLISCNKDYPETFYGIRLGKNSKEEFLKAKKDGLLSIDEKTNKIIMTLPFGGVIGKIDFWTERFAKINTDGVLSQIDINFYNKKNNDEYLLNGKYQQNKIVDFFEKKYGVIDKKKTYTDLNDESKNQYYSMDIIDLGYGFPKIKETTYQWLIENLKVRLTIKETEDNKYMAFASYFYLTKYQDKIVDDETKEKIKKF